MTMQHILALTLQASIALTVLGLGLTASWRDASYLFRQPRLLLRSMLSMSIVMPLVAVAMAKLFTLPIEIGVALVALSIAPVPPVLFKRATRGRRPSRLRGGPAGGHGAAVDRAGPAVGGAPERGIFHFRAGARRRWWRRSSSPPCWRRLPSDCSSANGFRPLSRSRAHIIALGTVLLLVAAGVVLWSLWPVTRTFFGNGLVLILAVFALLGLCVGHLLGGPVPGDRTTLAMATSARHPAVAWRSPVAPEASKQSVLAVILLYVIMCCDRGLSRTRNGAHAVRPRRDACRGSHD